MEEVENEKQLLDNLQKCRCCFRMLIDDRKAVQIDENIRNQFFSLTQIEVKLFLFLNFRLLVHSKFIISLYLQNFLLIEYASYAKLTYRHLWILEKVKFNVHPICLCLLNFYVYRLSI